MRNDVLKVAALLVGAWLVLCAFIGTSVIVGVFIPSEHTYIVLRDDKIIAQVEATPNQLNPAVCDVLEGEKRNLNLTYVDGLIYKDEAGVIVQYWVYKAVK